MECLGKKRKGVEVCEECRKDFQGNIQLAIIWSHLSLEGYSRRRKKCKELVVSNVCDSGRRVINEVVTAPPCGVATLELPGRGLKRKIGCIDVATQMGRKKKIDQEYELVKTIGKGKFGVVWLCRRKATGKEFACKTLQKGEEIVHREVEIMQHLSGHPGVVTLKAVYEDTESFHLVMELCSGGRLVDQMRREGMYSEWRAANIIKELMLAIRYCHEMGVVHRDVKPENILLTSSGQMKLADFGLAVRILHGQTLTGIVGSPAYVAPEVLEGNYSEKVDIWSAGVLLHALLAGFLPFQGDSLEAVFEAIKKEKLDFNDDKWGSISQPARNLLSGMLTRSVPERFTANQVLKHPWISFYTEPTLMARTVGPKLSTAEPLDRFPGRKRSTSDGTPTDEPTSTMASAAAGNTSEREEGSFVDVLAAAISRVRISEPKRSRICSPSRAIQQECSCNLQSSNLCTAF